MQTISIEKIFVVLRSESQWIMLTMQPYKYSKCCAKDCDNVAILIDSLLASDGCKLPASKDSQLLLIRHRGNFLTVWTFLEMGLLERLKLFSFSSHFVVTFN